MSDTITGLFAIWVIGTLLSAICGALLLMMTEWWEPERRAQARFILTCWAWPIWAIAFTIRSIRQLIAIATQETK